MSNVDVILSIPEALSRCILAEWLELRDVVALDDSYCSTGSRAHFHALLSGPNIFHIQHANSRLNNVLDYVRWLNKRSVHVPSLQLPRELAIQPAMHIALCDEFLRKCGSTLHQIDFQSLISGPIGQYACMDIIIMHCPNLVDLMLPRDFEISAPFLKKLSIKCPHLEELSVLAGYKWYGLNQDMCDWSFPALKSLSVSSGQIGVLEMLALADVTPNVESVSLFNTLTPDFILPHNIKVWNNLRMLEICDSALNDALVQALLSHHTQLTSLHLENPDYPLTDASTLFIAHYCPKLLELHIHSESVTDHGVCSVLEHCVLLTTLYLDRCTALTDVTLRAMAKYSKQLNILSIAECSNFTRLALLVVISKCKKLNTVIRSDDARI